MYAYIYLYSFYVVRVHQEQRTSTKHDIRKGQVFGINNIVFEG